jgi:hypothetical protein
MEIDQQRIAAMRALEEKDTAIRGEWLPPGVPPLPLTAEADAMHGALMRRANALAGCTEGSKEEIELKAIIDLIEANEAKRWPRKTRT